MDREHTWVWYLEIVLCGWIRPSKTVQVIILSLNFTIILTHAFTCSCSLIGQDIHSTVVHYITMPSTNVQFHWWPILSLSSVVDSVVHHSIIDSVWLLIQSNQSTHAVLSSTCSAWLQTQYWSTGPSVAARRLVLTGFIALIPQILFQTAIYPQSANQYPCNH